MSLLSLTVRVGEAVQIGDAAVIKINEKNGRRVGLTIATMLGPIVMIPSGLIPARFAAGLSAPKASPAPKTASEQQLVTS